MPVEFVMVDWQIFATLAAPILTLFLGVWINRRFENRPVLLSHWGHVSSFNYQRQDGTTGIVNTHSVVITNAGRRAATNVRLSHTVLPDFNIWPAVEYQLKEVPNSGPDIVIPTLVPSQYLTISYLYFPPVTYASVNAGVRCDEGFATQIPVLLQRQYPTWYKVVAGALMILGMALLVYGLFEIGALMVGAISHFGGYT